MHQSNGGPAKQSVESRHTHDIKRRNGAFRKRKMLCNPEANKDGDSKVERYHTLHTATPDCSGNSVDETGLLVPFCSNAHRGPPANARGLRKPRWRTTGEPPRNRDSSDARMTEPSRTGSLLSFWDETSARSLVVLSVSAAPLSARSGTPILLRPRSRRPSTSK